MFKINSMLNKTCFFVLSFFQLISFDAYSESYGDTSFNHYCEERGQILSPNYSTSEVSEAADLLTKISLDQSDLPWYAKSIYFYSDVMALYSYDLTDKPQEVDTTIHKFLVYLCGEYRDRPEMIAAKLNWFSKIHSPSGELQKTVDTSKPIWDQLSGRGYFDYLKISNRVLRLKKKLLRAKSHTIGRYSDIPFATEPFTVCETKFIVSEFVAKNNTLPREYNEYVSMRNEFADTGCSDNDHLFYYNFRGDKNLKPNSPEANGMIWEGRAAARMCQKEDPESIIACQTYINNPFASRWSAARAGLGSWLLYGDRLSEDFSDESKQIFFINTHDHTRMPFALEIEGNIEIDYLPGWEDYWQETTFGLDKLSQDGLQGNDLIFNRIRNAVNRHADWYASGYRDSVEGGYEIDQFYSPFVASSFEMSRSDLFTTKEGMRHWMFIFKVAIGDRYSSDSLVNGKIVDFENHWLDESSFGDNRLTKKEVSWDRLGTPLEQELEKIMYLGELPEQFPSER